MSAFDVEQALAHWDELDPEMLARLERDPVHGPRLRRLRRADTWLGGSSARDCPPAEDLYDYGRGPGFRRRSDVWLRKVEEHVGACAECRALVASLAKPPPLPLSLEGLDESRPSKSSPVIPLPAMRRTRPVWRSLAPLAAAAAVLLLGLSIWKERGARPVDGNLAHQLLRGEGAEDLLHPRGPLLVGPGSTSSPIRFEVRALERATLYIVQLKEHAGGAFEEGREIERIESALPVFPVRIGLEPGSYTWEAWAVVDGLEHRLGARDFHVRRDVELSVLLAKLDPEAQVRALLERGFETDARTRAMDLPSGPVRDAVLERVPAR